MKWKAKFLKRLKINAINASGHVQKSDYVNKITEISKKQNMMQKYTLRVNIINYD